MVFDWETAWAEMAKPEFDALPPAVHELYGLVIKFSDLLKQDTNLQVNMVPVLQERFDALDTDTLNHAQAVIYAYGHWCPGSHARDTAGAYWKFENLAKQVLTARLLSGGLKVPGPREWKSLDTSKYQVPQMVLDHRDACKRSRRAIYKECHEYGLAVPSEEEIEARMPTPPEPKTDDDLAWHFRHSLTGDLRVAKVTTINHRLIAGVSPCKGPPGVEPYYHHFMITQKHMEDGGMYLRPESAPCGHCGRDYDEHTYDRVMVVAVSGDKEKLSDEDQAQLKTLVPDMEKYKIQGFVFTKGKT